MTPDVTPGVATGADTSWIYRWEDEFAGGDPSDDEWKTYGKDLTVDTLEGSNNAVRMFDPGSREAKEIIETNFDGSVSITFTLSNPWWIPAVIDTAETSGTEAPFTHEFEGEIPRSMEILSGLKKRDEERHLLGVVITSASVEPSYPDEVTVSLDGAYADEDTDINVNDLVEQVETEVRPYTYAEAQVHLAGEPMRKLQNASLSIENNTDIVGELGTRLGVDYSPKERNSDLSHSGYIGDDTEDKLQRMYGGTDATGPEQHVSTTDEVRLIFEHKEDVGGETIEFVLGGSLPDSHSRSGIGDPTTEVEDSLDEMVETVYAVAENDVEEAL